MVFAIVLSSNEQSTYREWYLSIRSGKVSKKSSTLTNALRLTAKMSIVEFIFASKVYDFTLNWTEQLSSLIWTLERITRDAMDFEWAAIGSWTIFSKVLQGMSCCGILHAVFKYNFGLGWNPNRRMHWPAHEKRKNIVQERRTRKSDMKSAEKICNLESAAVWGKEQQVDRQIVMNKTKNDTKPKQKNCDKLVIKCAAVWVHRLCIACSRSCICARHCVGRCIRNSTRAYNTKCDRQTTTNCRTETRKFGKVRRKQANRINKQIHKLVIILAQEATPQNETHNSQTIIITNEQFQVKWCAAQDPPFDSSAVHWNSSCRQFSACHWTSVGAMECANLRINHITS